MIASCVLRRFSGSRPGWSSRVTYSSSSCRFACTKPIGLLSSCATPATSWPSERIFSLCTSCACVSRSSCVRSSTRASSVLLSCAISSKARAFSIAIALWFASVPSSWRSSGPSRSPESFRPTAITPSRSTPNRMGSSSSTSSVSKTSRQPRAARGRAPRRSPRARAPCAASRVARAMGWSGASSKCVLSSSQSPRAASARARPALLVHQQHHRALDAHRVAHRDEDAVHDLASGEHRDHGLGDLAHGAPVGRAVAVEEAVHQPLHAHAQRIEEQDGEEQERHREDRRGGVHVEAAHHGVGEGDDQREQAGDAERHRAVRRRALRREPDVEELAPQRRPTPPRRGRRRSRAARASRGSSCPRSSARAGSRPRARSSRSRRRASRRRARRSGGRGSSPARASAGRRTAARGPTRRTRWPAPPTRPRGAELRRRRATGPASSTAPR